MKCFSFCAANGVLYRGVVSCSHLVVTKELKFAPKISQNEESLLSLSININKFVVANRQKDDEPDIMQKRRTEGQIASLHLQRR